MKKFSFLLCVLATLGLYSCTEEAFVEGTASKGLTAQIPAYQFESDTRVGISQNLSTYTWSDGDQIGMYYQDAFSKASAEFTILSGGSSSGVFANSAFSLKPNSTYYAFYPYDSHATVEAYPVDFTGQEQTANGSTAHIGARNYMSAAVNTDANGSASIAFQNLAAVLQIEIPIEETGIYTDVTLATTGTDFITRGTLDMKTGVITPAEKSKQMVLSLGAGIALNKGDVFTANFLVAPTDLSGKELTVTLASKYGEDITTSVAGKAIQAGKAYKLAGGTSSEISLIIEGNATISRNGEDFETDFIGVDNDIIKNYKVIYENWATNAADGKLFTVNFYSAQNDLAITNTPSEALFAKLSIKNADAMNWKDGETFTQSMVLTPSGQTSFKKLKIMAKLTKVMPTSAPDDYTARVNQINDGVWNIVLSAFNSSDPYKVSSLVPSGYKDLNDGFRGLQDDPNYIFSFAMSKYDEKGSYTKPLEIYGANGYSLQVDDDLIDGITAHNTKVYYNYGQVSSEKKTDQSLNYYVQADEFNTIYSCWYDFQIAWSWKNYDTTTATNIARYGQEYTVDLRTIYSINSYNHLMFSDNLANLLERQLLKFEEAVIKGYTPGSELYFSCKSHTNDQIIFTPINLDKTTNPTTSIQSTLVITVSDLFHHNHTVSLPIEVIPAVPFDKNGYGGTADGTGYNNNSISNGNGITW